MPATEPRRAYVDTSVFGGFFDDEFSKESRMFFQQVEEHRFRLLSSALVADEISKGPDLVRHLFRKFIQTAELIRVERAALSLRNAYVEAGILTPKWADDALHVALATVGGANLIVSWNFRHIVHFEKIARYNAVNTLCGYGSLAIHSPSEVVAYAEE